MLVIAVEALGRHLGGPDKFGPFFFSKPPVHHPGQQDSRFHIPFWAWSQLSFARCSVPRGCLHPGMRAAAASWRPHRQRDSEGFGIRVRSGQPLYLLALPAGRWRRVFGEMGRVGRDAEGHLRPASRCLILIVCHGLLPQFCYKF